MQRKTKDLLNDLTLDRLRDLARHRGLPASGLKNELKERLARSFRGDATPLIEAMSRTELIQVLASVAFEADGRQGRFVYLAQARRDDLQDVATRTFVEGWTPPFPLDKARSDSDIRVSWARLDDAPTGRDAVMSTRYAEHGFASLSVAALRREMVGSRAVSMASAYYDIEFLRAVLLADGPPSDGLENVRIVLNGLAGPRLNCQLDELRKLEHDLRTAVGRAEIRLVFAKRIFHAKLFVIQKARSRMVLIGSANATTAAMEDNDEILLRLAGGCVGVEAYFDHVWQNEAHDLSAREGRLRTLVNFFRAGRLYVKTSTTFQMTVNPFAELVRVLPRDDRRKLSNVALRNSEPRPGVGPFAVAAAIGVSHEDASREDDDRHRASIKPYCVETCFGYWVPQALTAALDADLERAGGSKRGRFEQLKAAFDRTADSDILRAYSEYIDDARRLFLSLPSVPSLLETLRSDPFDSEPWFGERLAAIRNNLDKPRYVARLCNPYLDTPMPEIWDDPVGSGEFEQTFFEYIAYVSSLLTKSRVPGRILERSGCADSSDPSTVKESLLGYLRHPGWHDREDWERR